MTTARRTILALGLVVLDGAIGCASTGERTRAGWANITSSPREQEAAASQPKSPSGRPEVIVPGATKKQVMDALTLRLASSGWNVTQINDYQAIYDTDAKGAVGFLSGVVYGQATKPLYRLTAQFLETQTGVRLIGNLELVTNPGTPRTTRTDMNRGKPRQQIQSLLDGVRDEAARMPHSAPTSGDSADSTK